MTATVRGSVVVRRFSGPVHCAVSCEMGMAIRRVDGRAPTKQPNGGVSGSDLIRITLFNAGDASEDVLVNTALAASPSRR
jgi:hypothetical protein